jgi:hypothetical protein
MRHASRKDANHAEIVEALRTAGAYVWDIELPVDLLVGYKGKTVLMELKTPRGKWTDLQKAFMLLWTGGTVATVRDIEGALRVLKTMGDE